MKESTESRAFLAWFLEHYYRLDECELFDCLCDGAGDKGIDGIYVNEPLRRVDFFQAYVGKDAKKTQGDNKIKTFGASVAQFKTVEGAQNTLSTANPELRALAGDVNLIKRIEDGFEMRAVYVTNLKADSSAHSYLKTAPLPIDLYDGVKLQKEFVTIQKTDPIATKFKFDISGQPHFKFEMGKDLVMVMAPIAAADLIGLEGVSNGDLFAWNVRQFLGRGTSVNKALTESIKDSAQHKYFPAFHNGVTVLAKKLTFNDKSIEISGYAVVNGCQSISSLYSNSGAITKDLRIVTKFVQVMPDSDLARKITDHTNNQNGTTPRDLQSNNNVHIRLQSEIHRKYPQFRYRIKRGEHPEWNDNKTVIENEQLGRILLAFDLDKPETWSQNYKLFDELHGDIFGRPQVNADRALYAFDTYEGVMNNMALIDDSLFSTYTLSRWLVMYRSELRLLQFR